MRRTVASKIIKALAWCGIVVLFAGCPAVDESGPPPKEHGVAANRAAIRDVFDRYKKAVIEKNGKTAADLVSSATLDYYDDIQQLAATAGPAQINQQSLVNRLLITRTRLELKPARVRKLTGRDLFATGIE